MASAHTFQAPSLALLAAEPLRALFDFLAGKAHGRATAVGDGHPVIVYPGLGGAPFTTSGLRGYLREAGFEPHDWGHGVNTGPEGDFDTWLGTLEAEVRALHAQTGRKVSLVGWSLGGIYARELAKRAPECVRQVITLGTPFASLGGANHAGTVYRLLNGDTSQLTPQMQDRLKVCPPVPTTAVYSRSDGVVSWRGCMERKSASAESVEVTASHLGMVTHPQVLRVLAERLGQPEGGWKPRGRSRARR